MAEQTVSSPDTPRLILPLPEKPKYWKDKSLIPTVKSLNGHIHTLNEGFVALDRYCHELQSAIDSDNQSRKIGVERKFYRKWLPMKRAVREAKKQAKTMWEESEGTEIHPYYEEYEWRATELSQRVDGCFDNIFAAAHQDFFNFLNSDLNKHIQSLKDLNKSISETPLNTAASIVENHREGKQIESSCCKTLKAYDESLKLSLRVLGEDIPQMLPLMKFERIWNRLQEDWHTLTSSYEQSHVNWGTAMLSKAVKSAEEFINTVDELTQDGTVNHCDQIREKLSQSRRDFSTHHNLVKSHMNELTEMHRMGDQGYNHTMKKWNELCSKINSEHVYSDAHTHCDFTQNCWNVA